MRYAGSMVLRLRPGRAADLEAVTAVHEVSARADDPTERARYARLQVLSRHGEAETVAPSAFTLGKQATDQPPLLAGP